MDDTTSHPPGYETPTRSRFTLGELDAVWDADSADEDEDPASALINRRYELGRLIGQGGTARVYRAYDHQLDREVAIKVFHRDVVVVEQRRRLQEAAVMGRLEHPGVVSLFDTGAEDGHTFLVMRLVDGQNLADRLHTGPLPPEELPELAARLSAALAYVHERGVTHRDLKPANILLALDGPLISDFGIAQALDATRVTATGAIVGTAAYMAPEQVLGELVGAPADVYSLGLILLECVTGVREYTGTMAESAVARLTRQPRIPPAVPPALADLLRRMTARDPAARPTAAAVTSFLTGRSPSPVVEDPPSAGPQVRGGSGRLMAGAVTAAAAIVVACVLSSPSVVDGRPAQAATPSVTPSAQPPPPPSTPATVADAPRSPAVVPPSGTRVTKGSAGKQPKKNPGKGKGHGRGGGQRGPGG